MFSVWPAFVFNDEQTALGFVVGIPGIPQHPVITDLNSVFLGNFALSDFSEITDVQTLPIHDDRLSVNRDNYIDRAAMILVLGHDRHFNLDYPENTRVVYMQLQLVQCEKPFDMEPVACEEVEIGFDSGESVIINFKSPMVTKQVNLP